MLVNHVLCIAIDQYRDFENLDFPVSDANDLISVLKSRYTFLEENVTLLYNENATRKNIIENLIQYSNTLTEQDTLLIYFAGHGVLNENKDGFWVAHDSERGDESSYVTNIRIINYIKQIRSLHTLLISDSCFSGSFFKNLRGFGVETRLRERKSRWGITAGRENQKVEDDSPFAQALVNYLRDNNEKLVSAPSLGTYLKTIGYSYTQIPESNALHGTGHESGEYVFELSEDDNSAWEEANNKNDIDSYNYYILNYPAGDFISEARNRLDKLNLERNRFIKELKEAIDKFRLFQDEGLSSELSISTTAIISYLDGISSSLLIKEKEEEIWRATVASNLEIDFKRYIDSFPTGMYRDLAIEKLKKIQQNREHQEAWSTAIELVKKQQKPERALDIIKGFMHDYPHSYVEESRNLLKDLESYKSALDNDSIEGLKRYINKGNGIYLKRASNVLSSKLELESINQLIVSKQTFELNAHKFKNEFKYLPPELVNKINILISLDQDQYGSIIKGGSEEVELLRDYINSWKFGIHVADAQARIDELDINFYNKSKDIINRELFEEYKMRFPDGLFRSDLNERLEGLLNEDDFVSFKEPIGQEMRNDEVKDILNRGLASVVGQSDSLINQREKVQNNYETQDKTRSDIDLIELQGLLNRAENDKKTTDVIVAKDVVTSKKEWIVPSWVILLSLILSIFILILIIGLLLLK